MSMWLLMLVGSVLVYYGAWNIRFGFHWLRGVGVLLLGVILFGAGVNGAIDWYLAE